MLAIVIPYYKLTFFEATLLSLANQTNKQFKVYIGDDASPEDPLNLLTKFVGKFDFVYRKFEVNLGGKSLVKQWDRCIAMTIEEEWIMVLGDDDFLDYNVVESWYDNYNEFYKKTKVIRFATKIVIEETKSISDIYRHPVWEAAADSFYRKFEYLTRSSLSEYVFYKGSYLKYGFQDYPLGWHSDDKAWLDFSENKPIFTINKSVIFIRISQNSVTGKEDNFIDKNLGTYQFHKFIVLKKLKFYNKQQRKRLLDKYENAIKKLRELYLAEWFLIMFSYLKYFDWLSLKKVVKRFIKSVFKI